MSIDHVRSLDGALKIAIQKNTKSDLSFGKIHLLFTHATGFCKETWEPLLDELQLRGISIPFTVMDFRGHGDSVVNDGNPPFEFEWHQYGEDVLAVIDHIRGSYDPKNKETVKIVGIGLSMGAAALAFAEIIRPGAIHAMFLIEPIVCDDNFGMTSNNPLAIQAERRKRYFDSLEAANEYWKTKPMMKNWSSRAVDSYVRGSLKESADKSQGALELKCHPLAEAATYRALGDNFKEPWEKLQDISSNVVCVGGSHSNLYNLERLQKLCSQLKKAKLSPPLLIPGTSHFAPLERPDLVADEVAKFLSNL